MRYEVMNISYSYCKNCFSTYCLSSYVKKLFEFYTIWGAFSNKLGVLGRIWRRWVDESSRVGIGYVQEMTN